jgi:hypothetical protein
LYVGCLAFTKISPSDGSGAERWRIPATPRASRPERFLNSGDSKVDHHHSLCRGGSEFDPRARPPAKGRPFVNQVVSSSSKSKCLLSLLSNLCVFQNTNACHERHSDVTRNRNFSPKKDCIP